MTLAEIEQLIVLLRSNGISRFKSKEISLHFTPAPIGAVSLGPVEPGPPLQAIPPVEAEIKHHVNEVRSLLKLSDEALVDKMFPDYSQTQEA